MIPQLAAGMGGMMAQQPLVEQPKPRAGMFGAGSSKPDWAGAIQAALNGFLAARGNPVGMMGLQQMQMARQQALEEAKHQTRRGESFEDWVKQQAWKRANPDAANPHRWESNDGSLMELGPDGTPKVVYKDPTPRVQFIPNGLGGVIPINMSQFAPSVGGGELLDELPPGAKPIGGPTPPASGSFPRPY
jgi:hypothetical protein